jgi:rhamnogalacturonan endolyase
MKTPLSAAPRCLLALAFISAALAVSVLHAAGAAPVVAKTSASAPVTVTDAGNFFTLSNGVVTARINKRNGDLESLFYKGIDTMGHEQGYAGHWEQDPSGAAAVGGLSQSITIDPAKNGGTRAEVAVKGVGGGRRFDMEVRYALGRGESGIYAYAIFSHPASYGAMGAGESRYITKLNKTFNWISVDADRNMLECTPADWGTGVVVHAKEQRILSTGYYKNSVEH